jgi:hypothetical protein
MKPLVTLFVFFTTLPFLFCQNDTTDVFFKEKFNYTGVDWNSLSMTIGFNKVYTEGGFKNFVTPLLAINAGFDVQYEKKYFGFHITGYPSELKQTFTNKNRVWKQDTGISFTTGQIAAGYQLWASKRIALYVFGALGFSEISVEQPECKTCNCKEVRKGIFICPNNNTSSNAREKGWSLYSFAPSGGIFFEYRKIWISKKFRNGYWDNYLRLQATANPVWFQKIGNGVLYNVGLSYSFGIFQ